MNSSIVEFHLDFYIIAIQKLELHLTHERILGTCHCGNTRQDVFRRRSGFQDVLCCCDYAERIVARFSHQIQYE